MIETVVTTPAERARLAARVFAHYGTVCACPGCGATENLTIDHVDGDGTAHRIELFGTPRCAGYHFYRWLIRQGFPDGYQTLCQPCNQSKRHGSACRIDHAAPPGWKRCYGPCGQTKPLGDFSLNDRGLPRSKCRPCYNAIQNTVYRARHGASTA
jgi:hypothetical protein